MVQKDQLPGDENVMFKFKLSPDDKRSSLNLPPPTLYNQPDLNKFNFSLTKRPSDLRIYYSNVRGFHSKREIISKIMFDTDVDCLLLTETHASLDYKLYLPNYKVFFRNRRSREKGGIAICVKNDLARNAVQVFEGDGEEESLGVLLADASPPVVLATHYGTQNNSFGADCPKMNLKSFFGQVELWTNKGYECILISDFNQAMGRVHIPTNDVCLSTGGKIINDRIQEYGLFVANNLSHDATTHCDLKTKLNRCLDVALVSKKDKISQFYIDHEFLITPFNIRSRKGVFSRVNSDHKAILLDYSIDKWKVEQKIDKKVLWQFNKKDNYLYEELTDVEYSRVFEMVNAPDVNTMIKRLDRFLEKCKHRSYRKKTVTNKKWEEFVVEEVWRNRIDELVKLQEDLEDERDANKVFKTKIMHEVRSRVDIVSSIKDPSSGDMLEDVDMIMDHILEYNKKNMEKYDCSEDIRFVQELKSKFVEQVLKDKEKYPSSIPWEVYLKIVKRTYTQNKPVFRDFLKTGPKFKIAVYYILNRIYREEKIPENFYVSTLTKIFKNKGSRDNLKDHRFIHNRLWYCKLLEKCLVLMIEKEVDEYFPESQIGGLSGHSTREHILTIVTMLRYNEAFKKPSILTLLDVERCFDAADSADIYYDIAAAGANPKALSVLMKLNEKTTIKLSGDIKQDRTTTVNKTLGQGTALAGKGISLTMGLNIDEAIPESDVDSVGDIKIRTRTYYDDALIPNKDTESTRKNAKRLSNTLELISLRANTKKTVIIVSSNDKDKIDDIKCDFNNNPVLIHQNKINFVPVSDYLGFSISENGLKDSISISIKN